MKRYFMPEFWPIPKKGNVYATSPVPGPHPKYRCIPLRILVRDVLKLAESSAEVKKILNAVKVLVDKKVRKEPGFPVGLMDVIEIPEIDISYRVNVGKKGLLLEKIKKSETGFKLCKIIGKKTLKGKKQQFNLHDGRNILVEGPYKVGDSVLIEIPTQKILHHFPLKKGETVVIISGRNIGIKGKIKEIKERKSMLERSMIMIESDDGKEIETPKDYLMVGNLQEIRTKEEKNHSDKGE
ncbi:MAG: 30S ribosomal protein S4e [Candidatus Aenigmatarchaeota archaeon]